MHRAKYTHYNTETISSTPSSFCAFQNCFLFHGKERFDFSSSMMSQKIIHYCPIKYVEDLFLLRSRTCCITNPKSLFARCSEVTLVCSQRGYVRIGEKKCASRVVNIVVLYSYLHRTYIWTFLVTFPSPPHTEHRTYWHSSHQNGATYYQTSFINGEFGMFRW